MQFFGVGKRNDLKFLSDSAEQIARSINMTSLRTEIDQSFATAIARAGGHPQRSFGPTVNEAREVDAGGDASMKHNQYRNSSLSVGDVSARPRRHSVDIVEMTIDSLRCNLLSNEWALILKEKGAERYLPIYIGPRQANIVEKLPLSVGRVDPAEFDLSSAGIDITFSNNNYDAIRSLDKEIIRCYC